MFSRKFVLQARVGLRMRIVADDASALMILLASSSYNNACTTTVVVTCKKMSDFLVFLFSSRLLVVSQGRQSSRSIAAAAVSTRGALLISCPAVEAQIPAETPLYLLLKPFAKTTVCDSVRGDIHHFCAWSQHIACFRSPCISKVGSFGMELSNDNMGHGECRHGM